MGLAEFLNDQSLGAPTSSWADEMDDMPTVPSSGTYNSRTGYGGESDRGFGRSHGNDSFRGGREDRYPPREQLPLPEKPPYTAHIGNLSWDTSEADIESHFSACSVVNVRLVRDKLEDRPKGFGYVEFGTLEGLKNALALGGATLAGRPLRVSVADPPKDRGDEKFSGEWRRSGPLSPLDPPRRGPERNDRFGSESGDRPERRRAEYDGGGDGKVRDFGNWERKGPLAPLSPPPVAESNPREFTRRSPSERAPATGGENGPRREFRERPHVERVPTAAEKDNEWRRGARPDAPPARERSVPTSPTVPHTRPKLDLKKRSELPLENVTSQAETSSSKFNPFGGAKPIDNDARLREVEARRAALKKEQEEKEQQEAELKKAQEEASIAAKNKQESEPIKETADAKERADSKPERSERPERARFERTNTGSRDQREYSGRGGRGGRGGRDTLGREGSTRDWNNVRRGSDRQINSPRRVSRDDAAVAAEEASTRAANRAEVADIAEVEPTAASNAEDGWSTVPTKKGRGGSKVALAS